MDLDEAGSGGTSQGYGSRCDPPTPSFDGIGFSKLCYSVIVDPNEEGNSLEYLF